MKLLVAGGAGFIGSNYVRHRIDAGDEVRVLDKLTYAGRRENLEGVPGDHLELVVGDIGDRDAVRAAIDGCELVVNFAAESHVDRSISSPGEFILTDVHGTYVLVEAARDAGIRYLQISTDEVYGSFADGSATETSPLEPSSPYSAAKAGGDLIVSAFAHTYGAEALIIRASNNYGPRQHPEKLIPLCILNAIAGDPVPVYGEGTQVRNWLHVSDHCTAIDTVIAHGEPGQVFNVGGPDELTNIDVVRRILALCGRDESLIEHVADRPGHDLRYSLSAERLRGLGWAPQVGFDEGIERTVAWYRDHDEWWGPIRDGAYRAYYERQYGRRLGSVAPASGGPTTVPPAAPLPSDEE